MLYAVTSVKMYNAGGYCVSIGDTLGSFANAGIVTITKNLVLINTINTITTSTSDTDYKIGKGGAFTLSTPSTSST